MYLSSVITLFYKPITVTTFQQIQTPNQIEITREPKSKDTVLDNYKDLVVTSISDSQEIKTIMSDIKKREVKSLSGTEVLDYLRMQTLTKPLFHLSLNYNDYKLNNQYFNFIEFNNRYEAMAVVIHLRDNIGLFSFFRPYSTKIRYYPIKLSKESIALLNSYVTVY